MKDSKMSGSTLQTATEATASAVATKTTYAGSIATVGGWVISSELIALCGLILAVLGFIVNLVFKVREDRRQAEGHRAVMESVKNNGPEVKQFLDELPRIMRSNRVQNEYSGIPKSLKKPTPPEPVDGEGGK